MSQKLSVVEMRILSNSDSPFLPRRRLPPHLLLHRHLLDQLVLQHCNFQQQLLHPVGDSQNHFNRELKEKLFHKQFLSKKSSLTFVHILSSLKVEIVIDIYLGKSGLRLLGLPHLIDDEHGDARALLHHRGRRG